MIFASIVFLLIAAALYGICAAWFLAAIPREKHLRRWQQALIWIIYSALGLILPNLWYNDIITITVTAAYYLAVGWFFYHRSRTGLLYQLIYSGAAFAAQILAIYLMAALYSAIVIDDVVMSYLVTVAKIFCIVLVTFGMRAVVSRRLVQDSRNLKIRGIILVPVCSVVLLFLYLIGAGDIFFVRYGYEWMALYCLLILGINGYCVYIWYDVAANRELKHKLELMQQQNQLTCQYYEEMERSYSSSRKIIHDIRNHLHALEQSVKIDDKGYLEDMHGMLNSLGLKFYSENKMLNIILNDKLKAMPKDSVECNMGGVSLDFLSDMDVTTIFANLLDNAAEAAAGEQDFWLKIRGEQIQDFTIIRIWNSYTGTYAPGRSGKEGHEGLGLRNVEQTVKKYNGELNVRYKEHEFSVTAIFPGG